MTNTPPTLDANQPPRENILSIAVSEFKLQEITLSTRRKPIRFHDLPKAILCRINCEL